MDQRRSVKTVLCPSAERRNGNDPPEATGTLVTLILVPNAVFQPQLSGLLGAMVDSRTVAGNT